MSLHVTMNRMHDEGAAALAGIDLNLLVAFDALARERSVTRAAERTGVTQSAMSHTLRRLRGLFDDALLTRGQGGMLLTPRAESLVGPVRAVMIACARLVAEPAEFDPATARRRFRIGSPTDLVDALIVPPLMIALEQRAPSMDLAVASCRMSNVQQALETGEIDVAMVPRSSSPAFPSMADTGLRQRVLFQDGFSCFLRAGHPALAKRRLTLAAYAKLSHMLVSPRAEGPGIVDLALASRGKTRRVALRVPTFGVAPQIVSRTDLVLTAPTAFRHLVDGRVREVKCPLPLKPHSVALVWHERFADDPAHRFFREFIEEVAPLVIT